MKIIEKGTRIKLIKDVVKVIKNLLHKDIEITICEGYNVKCNSYIKLNNVTREEYCSIKSQVKEKVGNKIIRVENLKRSIYYDNSNPYILLNDSNLKWENMVIRV